MNYMGRLELQRAYNNLYNGSRRNLLVASIMDLQVMYVNARRMRYSGGYGLREGCAMPITPTWYLKHDLLLNRFKRGFLLNRDFGLRETSLKPSYMGLKQSVTGIKGAGRDARVVVPN